MSDALDRLVRTHAAAAAQLKRVKRAGWVRRGVAAGDCESVADHTFGVALLALLLPRLASLDGVDRARCVALALVHDLAESIVGDITPHDRIDPAEKHRREEQAIRQICDTLGDDELLTLWLEFEAGETPEAKVARELDVIEMAMQAKAYERAGLLTADAAASFVATARARVVTDPGRALLAAATQANAAPPAAPPLAPPSP